MRVDTHGFSRLSNSDFKFVNSHILYLVDFNYNNNITMLTLNN